MLWMVIFHPAFDEEFRALRYEVQTALVAKAKLLEQFGPSLGRPHVDALKDSAYAKMKELRFNADDGVWRVAFAFDPRRRALVLCAGDKSGVSDARFYRELIAKADMRFAEHLRGLGKVG